MKRVRQLYASNESIKRPYIFDVLKENSAQIESFITLCEILILLKG